MTSFFALLKKTPLITLLMALLAVGGLSLAMSVPGNVLPGQKVAFVALGDTGSGAKQQFDVANQMTVWHKAHPFSAVVVLGDIIYPAGDVKAFGESRYKKPYQPLMSKGVPFWAILGNHDVLLSKAETQVKFYGMPARYYAKTLGNPALVSVFALDTNTFSQDAQQIAWLEKTLSDSKSQWKIVAGHHPMVSSGEHGNDGELKRLREKLMPILTKYQVPLYLAGHDHGYERFEPNGGVTQIISGGGGAYLREFKAAKPGSKIRLKAFHFLSLEATPEQLNIQAIDRDGKLIDTVTLRQ